MPDLSFAGGLEGLRGCGPPQRAQEGAAAHRANAVPAVTLSPERHGPSVVV
jgi:hypothetical protein